MKDRELRKEKELQEALTSLGQYRAKEQSQQATTTSTGLGSLGEDRSATKPIIIAPPSSFARKIGDDVLSFFARPSSSPSSPPGLYASPDSPLNSDAEATPKTVSIPTELQIGALFSRLFVSKLVEAFSLLPTLLLDLFALLFH